MFKSCLYCILVVTGSNICCCIKNPQLFLLDTSKKRRFLSFFCMFVIQHFGSFGLNQCDQWPWRWRCKHESDNQDQPVMFRKKLSFASNYFQTNFILLIKFLLPFLRIILLTRDVVKVVVVLVKVVKTMVMVPWYDRAKHVSRIFHLRKNPSAKIM